eukprot:1195302-Pyramimonas_sp.AAC.1
MQCFPANLEVLAAIEGNADPSFQGSLCRVNVQLPLLEHLHHEIDALLSPQMRHSMAVGHLLQQHRRLQGHAEPLHVLVRVRVYGLRHGRRPSTMH